MHSESSRLIPRNARSLSRSDVEDQLNGADSELDEYNRMEASTCGADCIKSLIFGGFDGVMASLIIISAAAGGNLSWRVVLVLGFSCLAAQSIFTGMSEFLSSKAHREYLQAEKRRELWEFKHYRDGEITEMINRFESRGMSRADAEAVVLKMAQYENFFVGLMVSEELGLQLPDDDDAMLLTDAFIMFLSFATCSIIPILVFFLGPMNITTDSNLFAGAITLCMIALVLLGVGKSAFSSSTWLYLGIESLLLGALCSAASYLIGASIMNIIAFW